MKLSREIFPHIIIVKGNSLTIQNKNGGTLIKEVKIKRLGESKLEQFAYGLDKIVRNERGQISKVWMFEKDVDTESSSYLFRLKLLSQLSVNQL